MLGSITADEKEVKHCNDNRYGMKFRSYRLGLEAGKRDSKHKKTLEKMASNPYIIPSEIFELLKKRARWKSGYDQGWDIVSDRQRKKAEKKHRRKL